MLISIVIKNYNISLSEYYIYISFDFLFINISISFMIIIILYFLFSESRIMNNYSISSIYLSNYYRNKQLETSDNKIIKLINKNFE